jgi:GNAT superfamily N-acetyltransferase
MDVSYFNYRDSLAENSRERSAFIANWWRIYADDLRWVPPYFPLLKRELEPRFNPHLARLQPIYLSVTAVQRHGRTREWEPGAWMRGGVDFQPLFNLPVAAGIVLRDPRRKDGAGYLALLNSINDGESLEHLLESCAEQSHRMGLRKLIGPTGISPHLYNGALVDCWDRLPPFNTPYNPPYLPDLLRERLSLAGISNLYHLDVSAQDVFPAGPSQVELVPIKPERLEDEYLPLFAAGCPAQAGIQPPDHEEAAFLLRWLKPLPLQAWLALKSGQPAGFALYGPDLASRFKQASGGRSLARRAWLKIMASRPTERGRLYFAGVLPEQRGQGIGNLLLKQVLCSAEELGWRGLNAGPLPEDSEGSTFLRHRGAQPIQNYHLFQWELTSY